MLQGDSDPYAVPKSMGIFRTITSPKTITSVSVATRIIDNHEAYKVYIVTVICLFYHCLSVLIIDTGAFIQQKRNMKKKASEDRYYTQKKFVSGD